MINQIEQGTLITITKYDTLPLIPANCYWREITELVDDFYINITDEKTGLIVKEQGYSYICEKNENI